MGWDIWSSDCGPDLHPTRVVVWLCCLCMPPNRMIWLPCLRIEMKGSHLPEKRRRFIRKPACFSICSSIRRPIQTTSSRFLPPVQLQFVFPQKQYSCLTLSSSSECGGPVVSPIPRPPPLVRSTRHLQPTVHNRDAPRLLHQRSLCWCTE